MKKFLLTVSVVVLCFSAYSQLLSWSPQYPADNSTITITMDATKGNKGLMGYTGTVYMHFGVITNLSSSSSDWKYVPTVWGTTTAPAATSLGNNKWSFTIPNTRAYFNAAAGGVPAGETILRIALLFRDAAGALVQRNADASDMYVPIYPAGTNGIQFTLPAIVPYYNISHEAISATLNQSVPVTATASSNLGTLNLYFNGNLIAGPLTGTNTISGNAAATTYGNQQFVSQMTLGGINYYDTVSFYLPPPNNILALPSGVQEGINYWPGCDSVTLVFYAPSKQNVVVLGDFQPNAWQPLSANQMNKTPDGNYYWITLKGLTPGFEYSYQYLVDNAIYVADPYTDKILDPWNDKYIPAATYPNLKAYPTDPNVSAGINGYLGVFQTCQTAYNWKVPNFVRPDKHNLVTYELLVRDFGANHNYQMLIDTISYFKRLGINAIELMPISEFSGNDSWGYNPSFYCAPDKYYGTKDKLKEFIDLCHQNGIAVILDVVYNQLDAVNSPEGKLFWDATNNQPAANNPWLNPVAPHPYSVFNDLNHNSTATQYWVERALDYWIKEFKVDGYRFDLAKGFTQTVSNTATIENFDGSRVSNLERYYNYVIAKYPATYMILEFLGTQRSEEQVYAAYGFLLWGNNNAAYNQCTMGYSSSSDFSKIMFNNSQEAFSSPAEMGYMESHDEERLMYKNEQYGNATAGYNVKDIPTGLVRQAAAAAVFLTTPGPKMMWQFGERGYDSSINSAGGRTNAKPPLWNYMSDPNRLQLWNTYSALINLRLGFSNLFNSTAFSYDFYDNNGLFRYYRISDSSTANGVKMNIVANLDITAQARTITFQNTGNWINYISNGTGSGLNGATGSIAAVASTSQSITLQPGEFHVYFYHPSNVYVFNGNGNWNTAANWTYGAIPPASLPAGSEIIISPRQDGQCIVNINQVIATGAKITVAAGRKILIPLNLSIQ